MTSERKWLSNLTSTTKEDRRKNVKKVSPFNSKELSLFSNRDK